MITITTNSIDMGFVGEKYNFELAYTCYPDRGVEWSLVKSSDKLPFGLTLSKNGVISGIPTRTQRFSIEFLITTEFPIETAKKMLTLNILKGLQIISESIPNLKVGKNYSATIEATGGVPPYTWKVDSLPIGLTFKDGIISGTPDVCGGIIPIEIKLNDCAGNNIVKYYFIDSD